MASSSPRPALPLSLPRSSGYSGGTVPALPPSPRSPYGPVSSSANETPQGPDGRPLSLRIPSPRTSAAAAGVGPRSPTGFAGKMGIMSPPPPIPAQFSGANGAPYPSPPSPAPLGGSGTGRPGYPALKFPPPRSPTGSAGFGGHHRSISAGSSSGGGGAPWLPDVAPPTPGASAAGGDMQQFDKERSTARPPRPPKQHARHASTSSASPYSPPPPLPAASLPRSAADDDEDEPEHVCAHDTFLAPGMHASPLCTSCQKPVARLYAMHVRALDLEDAVAELRSQLAARDAAVARAEAEAKRLQRHYDELEDKHDEVFDRCLAAEQRVAELEDEVAGLHGDVAALQDDVRDAREVASDMARDKAKLEAEVEDLTAKLFEEANVLVATESQARHASETDASLLQKRLGEVNAMLNDERDQARELKAMLQDMNADRAEDMARIEQLEDAIDELEDQLAEATATRHRPSGNRASVMSTASSTNKRRSVASSTGGNGGGTPAIDFSAIDSAALDDFLDFMSSAPATPLPKVASLPFLGRALAADLEPCLQFGAKGAPTARKLVDAMLASQVEIGVAPAGGERSRTASTDSGVVATEQPAPAAPVQKSGGFFSSFMSNKSSSATPASTAASAESAVPTKCTLCAVHADIPFLLTVDGHPGGPLRVCAYCRDRVVAACDFVAFVKNLRAGLLARQNVVKVWCDSLALRSRLLHARLGSLAAVDAQAGVAIAAAATRERESK
ncbi:RAB3A interacting protein [Blastocladiella emersonii ATCC 22665]|nr:RAB3A interacting protein [Blastocladiella emersonii ATCC 22665]